MTTLEGALKIICKDSAGELHSLKRVLGDDMVEELCITGFLTQGVKRTDNRAIPAWRKTKLAEKAYKSIYADLTEHERKMGKYINSLNIE